MRIVADTNVLISATFWKGDSFKIIEKVENKEIELIISKEIIEEYANVLNYEEIREKVKTKSLAARFTIGAIIGMATIVQPKEKVDIIKEDSDDNKFLEAALEGKADFIIGQDNHLLKIREFKGIKILKPEEFLKRLD